MMKLRRHMAYFLLLISMIMLVVPVIPHHHHADGLICMKNDINENCCNHGTDNNLPADHCCCDTGCLTTHYFNQPQSTDTNEVGPDYLWVATLFYEPILKLLLLPEQTLRKNDFIFRESLHGIQITSAMGLRAPPCA